MTNDQRTRVIDAAEQSENVYRLRQLVRIACDSSVSMREAVVEAHDHISKAHALITLQATTIDIVKQIALDLKSC